jgi:hypothetical protein
MLEKGDPLWDWLPNWKSDSHTKYLGDSQALVAHACNLSYSGDRDQEDRSSKPTGANSSRDQPYLEKPVSKEAGGVDQSVSPEFKPQYQKNIWGIILEI